LNLNWLHPIYMKQFPGLAHSLTFQNRQKPAYTF
jgi:hypothetical protein